MQMHHHGMQQLSQQEMTIWKLIQRSLRLKYGITNIQIERLFLFSSENEEACTRIGAGTTVGAKKMKFCTRIGTGTSVGAEKMKYCTRIGVSIQS